jgi:ATP-dependent HslUV protease, peptidase subunit HslV
MTTIVVVKKLGQVAIAADTLTKYGSYTNERAEYIVNHEKIFLVGDSYIGLSGAATADLAVRDFFMRKYREAKLHTPIEIFRVWNELHQILKEEFFLNPTKEQEDSFESSRMRVLIANPQGIFGVDSYRFVQEFTKFYAYGSGSEFALGALFAAYNSDLSAEELATLGVKAAAEFDDATGLPLTSYSLSLKKAKGK